VTDSVARGARGTRPESRETAELRAIRSQHPQLQSAVDLHLEVLEVQRRIQGRVPLPHLEITQDKIRRHQSTATPLLRFEDIPLDLSDLRLMVRQIADVLRRYGALEEMDYQKVQALGRDMQLVTVTGQWFKSALEQQVAAIGVPTSTPFAELEGSAVFDQVLTLSMRPFLSRCAEVLQQRQELSLWTHAHCALCGGQPDLSVITQSAERHLICGRCELRWKWEPLACPYCRNSERTKITSFATPDGQYRVYACDMCRRYLKAYDGRRATRPVMPMVDAVATLPLDAAAIQRGYSSEPQRKRRVEKTRLYDGTRKRRV
jgi:formate dehydrogenase formation protein